MIPPSQHMITLTLPTNALLPLQAEPYAGTVHLRAFYHIHADTTRAAGQQPSTQQASTHESQ